MTNSLLFSIGGFVALVVMSPLSLHSSMKWNRLCSVKVNNIIQNADVSTNMSSLWGVLCLVELLFACRSRLSSKHRSFLFWVRVTISPFRFASRNLQTITIKRNSFTVRFIRDKRSRTSNLHMVCCSDAMSNQGQLEVE